MQILIIMLNIHMNCDMYIDNHVYKTYIYKVNYLPYDKILDTSKFIVFADNKINATQILKLVLRRV